MSLQPHNLVTLVDGTKRAIESLQVGDLVQGRTGINSVLSVNQPEIHTRPVMTELGWACLDPTKLAELEWDTYQDIVDQQGTAPVVWDSSLKVVSADGLIQIEQLPELTVDISLDGDHTYYLDNLLVHNGGKGGSKVVNMAGPVTNIYNSNTTVNVGAAPTPVVTSGRVSGQPNVFSIGSTTVVSAPPDLPSVSQSYLFAPTAWNTVPYVPTRQVSTFSVGTTRRVPQLDIRRELTDAITSRDQVCNDMLTAPANLGTFSQRITGNGGATQWRFSERGVPTSLTVRNALNLAVINPATYIVIPRADSFSWIQFDTPVANGVTYIISYEIGGAANTVNINNNDWSRWNGIINNMQQRLQIVRNNLQDNVSGRSWGISDPTLIDSAIRGANDLRAAIGRPGTRMSLDQIGNLCAFLDTQLDRIDRGLFYTDTPQPVPAPPINTNPNRIYATDPRFVYMRPAASGVFVYQTPSIYDCGRVLPVAKSYATFRLVRSPAGLYYEPTGGTIRAAIC